MESAFQQIKDLIIGEVEKPNILGFSTNELLQKKSLQHFERCIENKFESIARKDSGTMIENAASIQLNIQNLIELNQSIIARNASNLETAKVVRLFV